jgi:hypothetical protein
MGFWTALHRSRLHPIGALPHTVGGYRPQQRVKQCDPYSTFGSNQSGGKAVDGLQGTLEAALTRTPPLAQRCPYHNRSDQLRGQHIHPQFLPPHLGGSAPSHVHPESRLDRAQIARTVPALAREIRSVVSAGEPRVEPGRPHDAHRGAKPARPTRTRSSRTVHCSGSPAEVG